jgi:hypothetical protein
MLEFIIESDEKINEVKYGVWIRFQDEPINKGRGYFCSGTALVIPDDQNKCWFDFQFDHSPDWKKIIKLDIDAPAYTFSGEELLKFGGMIACLINQYIARYN